MDAPESSTGLVMCSVILGMQIGADRDRTTNLTTGKWTALPAELQPNIPSAGIILDSGLRRHRCERHRLSLDDKPLLSLTWGVASALVSSVLWSVCWCAYSPSSQISWLAARQLIHADSKWFFTVWFNCVTPDWPRDLSVCFVTGLF